MSQLLNLYKKPLSAVTTADDDNVLMCNNSPNSKSSSNASKENKDNEGHKDDKQEWNELNAKEEEINFEENHFQIPPLFNWPITEETLWDDNCAYVFWASLCLPISKDPINPMAAVYDALEEFVAQMAEEDPNFVVFPHNLSEYE